MQSPNLYLFICRERNQWVELKSLFTFWSQHSLAQEAVTPKTRWNEMLYCWKLLQLLCEGCHFKEEEPGALSSPDDALKATNPTWEIVLEWLTAKFYYLQARQDFSVAAEKQRVLFKNTFKQLLEVMKGSWCKLTIPNPVNCPWRGFHTTDIHHLVPFPTHLCSSLCGQVYALSSCAPITSSYIPLFLRWEIKIITLRCSILYFRLRLRNNLLKDYQTLTFAAVCFCNSSCMVCSHIYNKRTSFLLSFNDYQIHSACFLKSVSLRCFEDQYLQLHCQRQTCNLQEPGWWAAGFKALLKSFGIRDVVVSWYWSLIISF